MLPAKRQGACEDVISLAPYRMAVALGRETAETSLRRSQYPVEALGYHIFSQMRLQDRRISGDTGGREMIADREKQVSAESIKSSTGGLWAGI